MNKERILKCLQDFDIPIISIEETEGPSITHYEVVLGENVKISKIRRLKDNIALHIKDLNPRIIVPIPGKNAVGIEIENKDRQIVYFKDLVKSREFIESQFSLPVIIGSTVTNKPYIVDLAKLPHLLVVGAYGQGVSVFFNNVITSLLKSRTPEEVKFILMDPLWIQFSEYNEIENSYLARMPGVHEAVLTDVTQMLNTLNSLIVELDNRIKLLKKYAVKNIREYNSLMNPDLSYGKSIKKMPYLVVIIDAYQDILMQAGKRIERILQSLLLKGRIAGIHVVMSTYRSDKGTITPAIQAFFPSRIAFRLFSKIESNIILNSPDAVNLIGRGDLLMIDTSLKRIQGAYIDDNEIKELCEGISKNYFNTKTYILPNPPLDLYEDEDDQIDELLKEATNYLFDSNWVSVSALQRKFRIGYNRVLRIMDQLKKVGIISDPPRKLLVTKEKAQEILSKSEKT